MSRAALIRIVERVPWLRDRLLASREYRIGASSDALRGWSAASTARRQQRMWEKVLRNADAGEVRADLAALASALASPEVPASPAILEVGCGTGYLAAFMIGTREAATYVGVDSSATMIDLARESQPEARFVHGSATGLPFADGSFDVVVDGAALIHIGDARAALAEYARVTRRAVILHSVTCSDAIDGVVEFHKRAYGGRVAEFAFGSAALTRWARESGLDVHSRLPGLDYDLSRVIGCATVSETWVLCNAR